MQWIKKYLAEIGVVLVIGLLIAVVAYFYYDYAEAKKQVMELNKQLTATPSTPTRVETLADLIAEVSRLIVLPTDETPTIATVNDLQKLQGQQFFVNAKVGDKVLIYTKAKKAILYDPQNQKIVEVAPLNLETAASTTSTVGQ
jgi:hypothetical protein